MKVMVTGGAGYIGSHCVLDLLKKKHDVVVVDNLSTGHRETVDTLKRYGNVDFYEADLQKPEQISRPFDENKDIGAVIHFAAFSQVGESCRDPQKYYMNNVVGSLNLLNQMIKHNVDKIVFSSTAATYGNPVTETISEDHPQNPINPYGNKINHRKNNGRLQRTVWHTLCEIKILQCCRGGFSGQSGRMA